MGKKGKGKKGGEPEAEGSQEQPQVPQQQPAQPQPPPEQPPAEPQQAQTQQPEEPMQGQKKKKKPKWKAIGEVSGMEPVQQPAQPLQQQPQPLQHQPQQVLAQPPQEHPVQAQEPPQGQKQKKKPKWKAIGEVSGMEPVQQPAQPPQQQQPVQPAQQLPQQPPPQQPPPQQLPQLPPLQPPQQQQKKKQKGTLQETQQPTSQQQIHPQQVEQPQGSGRGRGVGRDQTSQRQIPAGRGQPLKQTDRSRQSSVSSDVSSVGTARSRQPTPALSETSSVTSIQEIIGQPGFPFKEGSQQQPQPAQQQRQQPAQQQQQRQLPAQQQQPQPAQQQQQQQQPAQQQQQRQQPAQQQQQQPQPAQQQQQQRQQPAQQQQQRQQPAQQQQQQPQPTQQQQQQRQQPAQQQQQRQQPAQQQQPQPAQQQQQRQQPAQQQQQQPQPAQQQQQRQQPAQQPQQQPQPVQQQQQRQQPGQQQQQRPKPAPQQGAQPAQQPVPSTEMALIKPRCKDPRQCGTLGRKILLETNHIELKINPKLEIVKHYDVAIDPDKPKRLMRRVWNEYYKQFLKGHYVAFDDSKNAYSPKEIPEGSGEVQVVEDENGKPRTYKVTVKFAANVNLRAVNAYMASGNRLEIPQDALQCIDIVLRNASSARFVRVGRSYFTEPNMIFELGDGLQLWYGFFQSTVIAWKPLLNIDVAHKGFPMHQRVSDYMASVAQMRIEEVQIQYRLEDEIKKFLKGLKLQYEIPGQVASRRTYRVNGLGPIPTRATFALESGEQITVDKYFTTKKGYNIRYGNLPLIWVGPKDRKNYLPAELCTIVAGQVVNKKLNEKQTASMVRKAATNVETRKQKIMDSLRQANYNADPTVKAFGLNVGHDFEKVHARVLAPPSLQYNTAQLVKPSKGIWRANNFLQAETINNWTILNMARGVQDRDMDLFTNLLRQGAGKVGMSVEGPKLPYEFCNNPSLVDKVFQKLKDLRLVFVIVPDFGTDVYSKVKQSAELKYGCLTQCLKVKTLRRMNDATIGNILLKVNAKLNGRNHKIADISRPKCLNQPCMIMGADVTHPSPDQTDIPSVAAVCASYDASAFQYNFRWRLQPPRQEIIDDLDNIVKDQLMVFYKTTKCQPKHLIFFRDGVSEGQFAQVMQAEVMAIRRACGQLSATFKPAITFLVVQKRHHTRFFPTNPRDSEDRNGNVPAGTIVDTEITHPTDSEYYLVSHASIQGVARPTKYRVLYDDMNMNEDELQTLTYYLCHMFTRCTRSVSYPAPTYYAHLAAFRARVYLEGHNIDLTKLSREQASRVIQDKLLQQKPMFFV